MSLQKWLNIFVDATQEDAEHEQAYQHILGYLVDEPSDSRSNESGEGPKMMVNSYENSLNSGEVTIQVLIANMQSQLSSEDEKVRHRATQLLADIFENRTEMCLKPAVVHLFVAFFCNRLQDYPSLTPALSALIALVTHHGSKMDAKFHDNIDILQSLVCSSGVHIQATAQSIRSKAFALLKLVMEPMTSDDVTGQSGAADWLDGVVTAGEGEKDPRCLLQYLRILLRALSVFEGFIANSAQGSVGCRRRVFNAVACYFPITFTPPEDDTFGVTTSMLVEALQDVLCDASMLELSVPFLLDQLEDGSLQVGIQHSLCAMERIVQLHGLKQHHVLDILPEFVPKLYDLAVDVSPDASNEVSQRTVLSLCSGAEALLHEYKRQEVGTRRVRKADIDETGVESGNEASIVALHIWKLVPESLLTQSALDLQKGFSGLRGRHASQVAFQVAKAGYIAASASIKRILPLLLPSTRATCLRLGSALSRAKGGTAVEEVSPSIQSERNAVAAALGLVAQLLRCLPDESTSGTSMTVSASTDAEPSLLFPAELATELFQTILSALPVLAATAAAAVVVDNDDGGDAEAYAGPSDITILNADDTIQMATVLQVLLELLKRCPSSCSTDDLKKVLLMCADVSVRGKEALLGTVTERLNSHVDNEEPKETPGMGMVESSDALKAAARALLYFGASRMQTAAIPEPYLSLAIDQLAKFTVEANDKYENHVNTKQKQFQSEAWRTLAGTAAACTDENAARRCMSPLLQAVASSSVYAASSSLVALDELVKDIVRDRCIAKQQGGKGAVCPAILVLLETENVESILQASALTGKSQMAADIFIACSGNTSENVNGMNSLPPLPASVTKAAVKATAEFSAKFTLTAFSSKKTVESGDNRCIKWTKFWSYEDYSELKPVFDAMPAAVQAHLIPDNTKLTAAHASALVALTLLGNLPAADSWVDEFEEDVMKCLYTITALALYFATNPANVDGEIPHSGLLLASIIYRLPGKCPLLHALLGGFYSFYKQLQLQHDQNQSSVTEQIVVAESTGWMLRALCNKADIVCRSQAVLASSASSAEAHQKGSWQEVICRQFVNIVLGACGASAAGAALKATNVACTETAKYWVSTRSLPLWRQRLWHRLQKELNPILEATSPLPTTSPGTIPGSVHNGRKAKQTRFYCSLCLCCAAAHMPPAVISSQASNLVSYVTEALHASDLINTAKRARASMRSSGGVKAVSFPESGETNQQPPFHVYQTQCLKTLHLLGQANEAIYAPHLSTLIPILLHLAQHAPKYRDRMLAVFCTSDIASLSHSHIHPFKSSVLKALRVVANDRKRIVRKVAADCGSAWLAKGR